MTNKALHIFLLTFSVIICCAINVAAMEGTRNYLAFPFYTESSPKSFTVLPERFYAIPTVEAPVLVGPLCPCIGVVITNKKENQVRTVVFHVQYSSSLEKLVKIAKRELKIDQDSNNIDITIFSKFLVNKIYNREFLAKSKSKTHKQVFEELVNFLKNSFVSAQVKSIFWNQANEFGEHNEDSFLAITADGMVYSITPIKMAIFEEKTHNDTLNMNRSRYMFNFYRASQNSNSAFLGSEAYKEQWIDLRSELEKMIKKCEGLKFENYREAPFMRVIEASTGLEKNALKICAHCFNEGPDLSFCPCGKVNYCAKECQIMDRPNHKTSCKF